MIAVLVTRPEGATDPLAVALAELGYRVHAVPTVVTEAIPLHLPDLAGYDWVVLTSAAGVRALPDLPTGPRWAVVGPATARALRDRGVEPNLIPKAATGAAIADAIPDPSGARILLARADAAATDLPERLAARGALVDEVHAYRTVTAPAGAAPALAAALADPDLAAVVFASGSAVRGFVQLGGGSTIPAVTIGPRTSAVARAAGFKVLAESPIQSTAALTATVAGAVPQAG
ncbi:MAG: hypothetical protein NVS9B1_21660 [Candidatus Dormibacteraceae bacterium]